MNPMSTHLGGQIRYRCSSSPEDRNPFEGVARKKNNATEPPHSALFRLIRQAGSNPTNRRLRCPIQDPDGAFDLLVNTHAGSVGPGLGSNHEIDYILQSHNLFMLKNR